VPKYDFCIVGAGWYGSTFARLATDHGYSCLVIDKRDHIGGNAYTEESHGIIMHVYGPHIFHTNNKDIWDWVNRYGEFNNYINSPKAKSGNKLYSLPFNMHTFNELWGISTPDAAREKIKEQTAPYQDTTPTNLTEHALKMVGPDIYYKLINCYTRKQWEMDPIHLPASIIKRLPLRFTFDNNYFNDRYQGIPVEGYTKIFENLLDGVDVELSVDYLSDKQRYSDLCKTVVFTGAIDDFFDHSIGMLPYRGLKFTDHLYKDCSNHQGVAVINQCDSDRPITRRIEHRHFDLNNKSPDTIVTDESPSDYSFGDIPYYPIETDANRGLWRRYKAKAKALEESGRFIFGGRLAEYRYYDMHQVIASATKQFQMFHVKHD
jgi:UDP-galactopyranose mutase